MLEKHCALTRKSQTLSEINSVTVSLKSPNKTCGSTITPNHPQSLPVLPEAGWSVATAPLTLMFATSLRHIILRPKGMWPNHTKVEPPLINCSNKFHLTAVLIATLRKDGWRNNQQQAF